MNLIEILLYLRGKSTEEREKALDDMSVHPAVKAAMSSCFDKNGNLVDLWGGPIRFENQL